MTSRAEPTVSKEYVESQGRRRLFLRSWRPDGMRAVVAFVHEPGSDGARYEGIARTLAMQDIASYAVDLDRWSGSPVSRVREPTLARYLADIRTMMACVRQRHPTRPLYGFGHGTGALAVCCHALLHPTELDGIIGEAIILDPPWRAAIFRQCPRLGPVFRVPRMALVRADRRLRMAVGALFLPLLLLHGSEDVMAPPSGSEYLHRYAGSGDKTLQMFEDCDHDLINGRCYALVREKVCQWIEGQLGAGARRRIGIEYINE